MPDSRGLLHVNLNVSDLERSLRFYTEALGFVSVSVTEETADAGTGAGVVRQAVLTIPRTSTILALTEGDSFEVGPRGLNHLGLVLVSDEACHPILERVERLGGTIQKQGVREAAGVSEVFAYVRDPDGYAVELSTQAIVYSQLPE